MLRIMVTPRMPSGAGNFGCSIEPGRTITSSIAVSTPALRMLSEPSPSR